MSKTIKFSSAMQKALVAIRAGGGTGVMDRYGRFLIAGELLKFDTTTYLRLVAYGALSGHSGRLVLTSDGYNISDDILKQDRKLK